MKHLILPICLWGSFVLVGCNATVGTTLLSSYKACTTTSASTTTTDDTCTTTATTEGVIEINTASTASMNIDVSDTVEITGTCRDQGRKNNKILVQVFAGDLDESVDPYIDNVDSNKCLNTASGIATGEKCFSVTKGLGFKDRAGLPDETDFPTCHNGQFGFAVRLGKILTSTSLGTNYLVRLKLRTDDGTLKDTVWSRVVVSRALTAPTIDSITPNSTTISCALTTSVARFNQNIQYALQKTYVNAGVTSAAYAVPGFGTTSAVSTAYNYTDLGLIQGVTYTYSLVATEGQYSSLYGGVPQTATSNSVTCQMIKPTIYRSANPTSSTCTISLGSGSLNATVPTYDIGYAQYGGWAAVNGAAAPVPAACGSGSLVASPYQCVISGLASGQTYYFSVRNRGNIGEIGSWSEEVACTTL